MIFSIALVPIAPIAILCGSHGNAHAQSMGGGGAFGYAASDGIISPATIYYNRSNWGYFPTVSGFTTDPDGNYLASCATAFGSPSVSFSASLVYDIVNETGGYASNTIAVNIGAGGAVGAASSDYSAASSVSYYETNAPGSVPDPTSFADAEYLVVTTASVPDDYVFMYNGTASGSASAPASP